MELLTKEQLREQNYQLEGLEIKPYLSLAVKQLLIKNILSICTTEESNLKKIDFSLKEFAYEFTLVNQYSNMNCDVENIIEFYDELKEHGIIDSVLKQIPNSEIKFIDYVLRKEIEQIQIVDNSVSAVLDKALNKLLEKIPNDKQLKSIGKSLIKDLNKLEPSKLSYVSQAMGWLKEKS